MIDTLRELGFANVWAYDSEYCVVDGKVLVRCIVAYNITTGELIRRSGGELSGGPPFSLGRESLFVTYHAPAEMASHRALGWPLPICVLDLLPEVRNYFNGRLGTGERMGLLEAAGRLGIGTISSAAKIAGREVSMKNDNLSDNEMNALLAYCESDVMTTAKVLIRLSPHLDFRAAIAFRSRYTALAVTDIEARGAPIDDCLLIRLRNHWPDILHRLITRVDPAHEVYDEHGQFSERRWLHYMEARGIAWPRFSDSGRPVLDRKTFGQMASLHTSIEPFRQLRNTLAQLKGGLLQVSEKRASGAKGISTVGPDRRNRCSLFPFGSKTGRNQPSSTGFIFACPSWLRFLLKPGPGFGLAYIDIQQQEIGVAAALSRDPAMLRAYESADPYLTFGKQVGQIPLDGTRASHGRIRDRFKQCALGIDYGMQAPALAQRLGESVEHAEELIRHHRRVYARFWTWVENEVAMARLRGYIRTAKFGWTLHVDRGTKRGTLLNFHMQAVGAQILQLSCIWCIEAGIQICSPVHDAVLVQSRLEELDETVVKTRAIIEKATSFLLDGFRLRTDSYVVRHPDRFEDIKGRHLWDTIMEILTELEAEAGRQCA